MAKAKNSLTLPEKVLAAQLDMTYDPETGEYCVGGNCYKMRWNEKTGETTHEYDPSVEECSPLVRQFAQRMLEGAKRGTVGKTVFRERHRRKD